MAHTFVLLCSDFKSTKLWAQSDIPLSFSTLFYKFLAQCWTYVHVLLGLHPINDKRQQEQLNFYLFLILVNHNYIFKYEYRQ